MIAEQLKFGSPVQHLPPRLPVRTSGSERPGQVYMGERAERRASRCPPARSVAIDEASWRGLEAGGLVSFKDFLRFQEWSRRKMLTGEEAEEAIDRLIEKRWEQRVAKRRELMARRQAGRGIHGDEAVVILLFGPEPGGGAV